LVKNDNVALARYINAKRKKEEKDWRKEEACKKVEEEARKKAEPGQSSKDVWTWRK
jgi:outer membrane protein assembly factor BamE (lipoprotein component of BamABCDE complex)